MLSKSQRTRQFIVEQTAPVFNARGFAGTSLNDLMDATGLSKGSIYGNFENKDEVALAAFDHNFGKIVLHLKEKMDRQNNSVDKLLVYPEVYRQFLKLPILKEGCPVLNTGAEADDTHPLLRKKVEEALKFWRHSVVQQIKHGISKKQIRKEVNPSQFASVLMSLVEGAVLQAKITGNAGELKHSMDFLENLIEDLRPQSKINSNKKQY